MFPLQMLFTALLGWLEREQSDGIAFLREENRALKAQGLVLRMATENPSWGYTRIQGALKNVDHRVARSTIASILKAEGIPPSRERPMTWQTFLQAHWPALVAADFFTTDVWTARGLVTYYVAFVPDVQSRRVHAIGCTPYPDEAFVIQCLRQTTGETGLLCEGRILLCDRDPKWSNRPPMQRPTGAVRRRQRMGGILSYYYRSAA